METKVVFGSPEAVRAPEPKGSKRTYAIITVITTVLAGLIATTSLIDDSWKVEIIALLKAIDLAIYGIGKLFGVVEEK